MSDEFSGSSLDSTKWEPLDWSGRMPVEHSIDQVSLVNGEAVLEVDFKPGETTIAETAYTIDAGYFMSIDFQRYGYFEIRMKAQNYPIVTTWWLTGGSKTFNREIDMVESGFAVPGREYKWGHNYHVWLTPTATGVDDTHSAASPGYIDITYRPIDEYRTYGFEWDKDNMTLYLDGVPQYTRSTGDFRVGQRLMVGMEYNNWITSVQDMLNAVGNLPATYNIDYLRTWYKPDTDVRWYVDGVNGDDANDGLSWSTAKKTIMAAINESYNGDEIWVAQGVYMEYLTFMGMRNVEMYGGFRPGDHSLEDRRPELFPTLVIANSDAREVCQVNNVHGFRLDGFTLSGTEGGYESALRVQGPSSDIVIANCRMSWNNPAKGGGGGSLVTGKLDTNVRYENCVFANNSSFGTHAGSAAFYASGGAQVELDSCLFEGNETSEAGIIGVQWTDSTTRVDMTNCIVINNTTKAGEAAINVNSGTLTMTNCTVAGNSAHGVEIGNWSSIQPASFRNNIFYANVETGLYELARISTLENNLFHSNGTQLSWNGAKNSAGDINAISSASGNIVDDPLLLALAQSNVRLQATSPAINAALSSSAPALDADGNTRVLPDMGAYEFTGTALTRRPAGGINMQIPGRVDASAYDVGGQGVTFNDSSAVNQAQFYRGDGPGTEWKAGESSPNIGWTNAGDWMEYTVDIAPGTYEMHLRMGSTTNGNRIKVSLNGIELITATCPNTGSWSIFQTDHVATPTLAGGDDQVLRIEFLDGGMNCSWVEFHPAPLASAQDIGTPALAGTMHYDNGRYFVKGNGADLWGKTTDQFHYVHQVLNGDGYFIAKANEVYGPNDWGKSGIMFRESLAADAKYIALVQRPNNQLALMYRDTNSTAPQLLTSWTVGDNLNPKWLALARHGDEFRAYYSVDGQAWMLVAEAFDLPMAASLYRGLCVNPTHGSSYGYAIFSAVRSGSTPDSMVPADTDSDGDTVPDDWEIQYNTQALVPDSLDDPDGDGLHSGDEYLAGTHPNDHSSVFAATVYSPGTGYEVSFPTTSGRSYTVYRTEDITGTWAPLDTIVGSGSIETYVDLSGASKAFYKVEASLAP
ncbi:carbohydrate-binding domain-containing protein [Coraliomargarita akajimensis]|nr:carbohydrate-binding domain-containing protein [Coraliomargarita akajimensis]